MKSEELLVQPKKTSRIWIIIVNYCTTNLVSDCLVSLEFELDDFGDVRVVIVDNNSGDGSVSRLTKLVAQKNWGSWVDIIGSDRNGGFAFGNNMGIKLAMQKNPEYIMLLNPDTVVRPKAVSALVKFMQENPKVGIAGSLLESIEGGIDCSAHKIHSPLSELDGGARLGVLSRLLHKYVVSGLPQTEPHPCDWVSGASMIVRRAVIDDIGLMDDEFFLYFEEVDFCWRATKAGWQVWYVPQSRVLHLEGASTGIKEPAKRRASYWYDSRRRFFVKHYGVFGLLLADLFWTIGRLSLLLRAKLGLGGKGIDADPKRFMSDLLGGDLRSILSGKAWSIRRRPER